MQGAERGDNLDFSKIKMEEVPTRREPRLSFSDEFISDLRTRWDRRNVVRNNANQGEETPEEPLYDEVYEEALDMMAREEGTQPSYPRRRPLRGAWTGADRSDRTPRGRRSTTSPKGKEVSATKPT